MKEIDDTDLPKSESEVLEDWVSTIAVSNAQALTRLRRRIQALELRLANLETQRTPQDENDDPEWFS